jgi:hypothetical protein
VISVLIVLFLATNCSVRDAGFHLTPGLKVLRSQSIAYFAPAGSRTATKHETYKHLDGPAVIPDHIRDTIRWTIEPTTASTASIERGLLNQARRDGWTIAATSHTPVTLQPTDVYEEWWLDAARPGGADLKPQLGCAKWSDRTVIDCSLGIANQG